MQAPLTTGERTSEHAQEDCSETLPPHPLAADDHTRALTWQYPKALSRICPTGPSSYFEEHCDLKPERGDLGHPAADPGGRILSPH